MLYENTAQPLLWLRALSKAKTVNSMCQNLTNGKSVTVWSVEEKLVRSGIMWKELKCGKTREVTKIY